MAQITKLQFPSSQVGEAAIKLRRLILDLASGHASGAVIAVRQADGTIDVYEVGLAPPNMYPHRPK